MRPGNKGSRSGCSLAVAAVLLVEFAIQGDLGMKDATCQVDSESQNLILPREYYTRTSCNADHLPLLAHIIKFLGRSIHWVFKAALLVALLPRWRPDEGQGVELRAAGA